MAEIVTVQDFDSAKEQCRFCPVFKPMLSLAMASDVSSTSRSAQLALPVRPEVCQEHGQHQ
jgi:hypothetical protein